MIDKSHAVPVKAKPAVPESQYLHAQCCVSLIYAPLLVHDNGQLFRDICEKLFYTDIVIDDLPRFARNIDNANRWSNRRCRHTKRLFIEYWEPSADPPYTVLFENTDKQYWDLFGRTLQQTDYTVFWDCGRETHELSRAVDILNVYGMEALFPKLSAIAVASIYGKENNRWVMYTQPPMDDEGVTFEECGIAFNIFLNSGHLQHLCLRDSNGPLSLVPPHLSPSHPTYRSTLHLPDIVDNIPCPAGTPIRWTSDVPMQANLSKSIGTVMRNAGKIGVQRSKCSASEFVKPIDLSVFVSTARVTITSDELAEAGIGEYTEEGQLVYKDQPVNAEEQRLITLQNGEPQQQALREASGNVNDKLVWYPSRMTPICEVCGSGAPGWTEGTWVTGPYAIADEK